MPQSPFHAMTIARELSVYASSADRLVAAYASSDIEVYPYQIAAAQFALRSPYPGVPAKPASWGGFKGVVLADEGSLGKTYEALLVISELYYEGRDRILVVVPTPLLHQWAGILENRFSVPFQIVSSEQLEVSSFDVDGVALTTYEYAAAHAEDIEKLEWNIAVFEEAHRLAKPDNKTTLALKEAVGGAFKLLLTATPMQNSIMDLYGLIGFIDTGSLGDADEFYKRYFRKPENYGELTATASRYCFRTLRSQVESYVKIPRRIPVTADCDFERFLEKIAPEKPYDQYDHNGYEDNADAHLKRTVMGREVVVAVTEGKLDFGTWEQIFYGEFDGMRDKRVLVKIIGE